MRSIFWNSFIFYTLLKVLIESFYFFFIYIFLFLALISIYILILILILILPYIVIAFHFVFEAFLLIQCFSPFLISYSFRIPL